MNANSQIAIERILKDEIIDNKVFKYELINCIKKNNLRDWGIIDDGTKKKNIESLNHGAGILEAEYITCIGKITIYKDISKGDILIFKTEKTKVKHR